MYNANPDKSGLQKRRFGQKTAKTRIRSTCFSLCKIRQDFFNTAQMRNSMFSLVKTRLWRRTG
jgi:hypothetical protein